MISHRLIFFICFLSLASTFFAQSIYKGGIGDGFSTNSFAQSNNAALSIYAGGNSDGFSTLCYTQNSNPALNIYAGGNDDGFSTLCFTQGSNIALDIYSGGNADGFSTLCFTQNSNTALDIYSGGNADGFSTLCYLQTNNPALQIYSGGSNDGFTTLCYLQSDNLLLNVYKGGIADGLGKSCLGTQANPVPLPIELISFEGKCEDRIVILKWSTATETNNDFFTVEKSLDGFNWQFAGNLPGAGNSTSQKNYIFNDNNSYGTLTYYRLKQTNYNGTFKYTGILYVDNCSNNSIGLLIYPNPNNGEFVISLKQLTENSSLEIYNNLGQLVIKFSPKENISKINLYKEADGVYFVRLLENGKTKASSKVLKN